MAETGRDGEGAVGGVDRRRVRDRRSGDGDGRRSLQRLVDPNESLRQSGTDPDYRFTMANERTFLAWVRTSLAMVAGGLGALHLLPDAYGSEVIGLSLLALALVVAASSFRRWYGIELALREQRTIPPSRLPQVMAYAMVVISTLTAVLFIVDVLG